MCQTRQFTDQEIASFMELHTMGIRNKTIAREYGCDHTKIKDALRYAKQFGMTPQPELAKQPPRFLRGRT